MTAADRLEFYASLIATAAAELAGEESKYPPPIPTCASRDCPQPAKPGCAGHCPRCWKERRALAHLY